MVGRGRFTFTMCREGRKARGSGAHWPLQTAHTMGRSHREHGDSRQAPRDRWSAGLLSVFYKGCTESGLGSGNQPRAPWELPGRAGKRDIRASSSNRVDGGGVRLLHATPHLPTLLFLFGVQGNTAPPRRQHVPASLAASHGPGAVSGSKGTYREVTGRKLTILEFPLTPSVSRCPPGMQE